MADILKRVRNLIALSKHNNSAEEAASAAAEAQALMFKYQIGEVDLDPGESRREPEEVVDESVLTDDKGKRDAWKAALANTLGRSFGCRVYIFREERACRYQVFGVKSAVQTVGYMFGYLSAEIDRMASEQWREHRRGDARSWKNSFRFGAVSVISERLSAQRAAQQAQVRAMNAAAQQKKEPGTALALYQADCERVEAGYEAKAKKLGLRSSRRSYRIHNATAYERGEAAGRELGLGGGRGLGAPAKQVEE